ncbi:MAG: amino acid ABC transporter substrate-binding protein [Eubacteriales bacterium]|nr:amino acid ABC transporter substrate-binding protein [Eubacteriales bacterium]
MRRKGYLTILLLAAGAMALTGCGQSGAAGSAVSEEAQTADAEEEAGADGTESSAADSGETEDLLEQIRERGELIVAMEGTWSPWTYHDENDELVGYDVEVARAIAEHLGVEATFVEGEWDGLFAGLDAGRYDMVVNGVDITEERAEKYDFTEPYAYNRTAVIVTGDNDEIQSFEDLEGKSTANTISSTYAELAESYGANVTGVDDLNQTFELLLSGRIDATLNAELTYYDYMNAHPDADIKIAALTEDASQVAIPLRRGEETENLRAAVNEAIDELRASGELAQISEKYFGSDVSSAPEGE